MTDDLNKQGKVLLHFRNQSANISLVLYRVHHDMDELGNNSHELAKRFRNNAANTTLDQNLMGMFYKLPFFHFVTGLAILLIIVGLAGLTIKLKKNGHEKAVKLTKCSGSVWMMLLGVMMSVSQATLWAGSVEQGGRRETYFQVAGTFTNLVRLAVLNYKVFTTTFYFFQNIVQFRLFSSSSYQKGFSSWLVNSTVARWVLSTTIFITICLFLTHVQFDQEDCGKVHTKEDATEKLVVGLIYFTFIVSFLLSSSYLVGYYKSYNSGNSENQINMKHVFLMCSLEIILDLVAVLYVGLVGDNCLATGQETQPYKVDRNCTGVETISNKDGVAECATPILMSQPLFQEIALLVLMVTG